jgi:outer membrane protein TolC
VARRTLLLAMLSLGPGCSETVQHVARNIILPEQRTIQIREPSQLPSAPLPQLPPPATVAESSPARKETPMSLDEAIRIALVNTKVVRVLAGISASTSGRTIYDTAITSTTIDQEQGRFDPLLTWNNSWNRTEQPFAQLNPFNPNLSFINATRTDDYRHELRLDKTNVLGGQWNLRWVENPRRFSDGLRFFPFPLNPENRSLLELSYTQPLLQGAGFAVNTAPIVIARIETERSFFQYKDTVQEMVRGVIEAYWFLVQARVDVWARQIQVEQSEEAFKREKARLEAGFADLGAVAQSRTTYNRFRAALIAAKANVLAREGALRNILGMPPSDGREIVPVSAPTSRRAKVDWPELLKLIEQRRPDIVELKLILEADQQRLMVAENQALPRLDAVALYRWNGLSGEMPNGERLDSGAGRYTDWTLGINFSVPLGLREARARVRQSSLLILRDKANLDQGLHFAASSVAITVRDIDNFYEQYKAFRETRAAALDNLKVQIEQFRARRNIYLNVLQALNDWGDAVSSEAGALISYNIALATLERQSGTILETHGLVFNEERFAAAGPLGKHHPVGYPAATPPTGDPKRYPPTSEPGENAFDLQKPVIPRSTPKKEPEQLPLPRKEEEMLPRPRKLPPPEGGVRLIVPE